jgi:hypothetical protein
MATGFLSLFYLTHRDPGTTKLYDRRGYNPEKAASFFAIRLYLFTDWMISIGIPIYVARKSSFG